VAHPSPEIMAARLAEIEESCKERGVDSDALWALYIAFGFSRQELRVMSRYVLFRDTQRRIAERLRISRSSVRKYIKRANDKIALLPPKRQR
jgi:hypothetical protein